MKLFWAENLICPQSNFSGKPYALKKGLVKSSLVWALVSTYLMTVNVKILSYNLWKYIVECLIVAQMPV